MRSKNILLTAAFGLIMSAITAQAANVQITSLPFNITAPGTYVLTSNLSWTQINGTPAITVATTVAGPVILNLEGFTLSTPGNENVAGGVLVQSNPTNSKITIRNGTIEYFSTGVNAGSTTGYLSNIHIETITFVGNREGISFRQVNSSTVSNCTFIAYLPIGGALNGISDSDSQGGNLYIDNYFDGYQNIEFQVNSGAGNPIVLKRCLFAAPAN